MHSNIHNDSMHCSNMHSNMHSSMQQGPGYERPPLRRSTVDYSSMGSPNRYTGYAAEAATAPSSSHSFAAGDSSSNCYERYAEDAGES